MKTDILNLNGEKIKDLTLDKDIFGIEPNNKVLKDAIIVAQSSLRQGTAKAKNRREVSGGGVKPWKQKGTGRARAGSNRSPIWTGGGITFGPLPRDYSKKQNRKERKLALRSAWSYKTQEKAIVVVEDLKLATPKTKDMLAVLTKLNLNSVKTLIVVNEFDENLILASRNLQNIVVELPTEISVLDLVSVEKVLIETSAIDKIKEVLK